MPCRQYVDYSIWPEQTVKFRVDSKQQLRHFSQLPILRGMTDYDNDSSPERPPRTRKSRDEVDISQVLPTRMRMSKKPTAKQSINGV